MLIESLIKRKNGTKVPLNNPDIEYHFKPESNKENAPHLADVTEKSHVAKFLAITEGYAVFDPSLKETSKPPEKTTKKTEAEVELKGSTYKPEIVEFGNGNSVRTSALIYTAFEKSGKTVEQWNKQTKQQIIDELTQEVALLDVEPTETVTEELETVELDNTDVQETNKPKTKAEKQAEFKARKAELGQD